MPRENVEITAGRLGYQVKSTIDDINLLSDTVDLTDVATGTGQKIITKAIYVGVSGTLIYWPAGQNTPVPYYNCPVGKWVCAAKRIGASSTADEICIDYDLPNV